MARHAVRRAVLEAWGFDDLPPGAPRISVNEVVVAVPANDRRGRTSGFVVMDRDDFESLFQDIGLPG